MSREIRRDLISTVTGKVSLDGESVPFFYAVTRIAGSLVNCFSGKSKKITLPEDIFIEEE